MIKNAIALEENDKNSIIVHEEFAKQNNLKLGDEVDLELLDIEKSGKIKSHKFKIINDKNSIIVHEEFAKQNNLKLGDEVDLELLDIEKSGKIKSHKFKIKF
ncbi:hypothetical protein EfmAA818_29930 (plasmid) [Enterococcus faecium]|nr:hypothetical protein EfmAA818_29930 [Enterococcus faecium]